MRAGEWVRFRDVNAAYRNWQRAREVADRLPVDDPDRPAMRIAPRVLICGNNWRVGLGVEETGFDELPPLHIGWRQPVAGRRHGGDADGAVIPQQVP